MMRGYLANGWNGFGGIGNCFRNGYMNGYGFGNNYGYMNNGWGFLIIFGVLAILALLIFVIVHNSNKKKLHDESLEILKMRFVRGEITEEEYLRRKSVLE